MARADSTVPGAARPEIRRRQDDTRWLLNAALGIGTVPYSYGVRLRYGAAVAVPYCHLAAQVRYGYGTVRLSSPVWNFDPSANVGTLRHRQIGASRPLPVPAKPAPLAPCPRPRPPIPCPALPAPAPPAKPMRTKPAPAKPAHPAWLSARAGPALSGWHKRNRWAAAGGAASPVQAAETQRRWCAAGGAAGAHVGGRRRRCEADGAGGAGAQAAETRRRRRRFPMWKLLMQKQ
ncbi:hypothetical protein GGX14DRAFT_595310 [Mycena pura]|uniref:Uncharacterized protein n=1 Tax=Mycena pura TaxID=153505 RepID=A0AAD6VS61_9AGAR|nr:hypothetical protein GGX14DRAFT_595310 [Mycena pura]